MSWKEVIAQVAPTLGTALGGPLGGMAANVICEALGLPAGSKDNDIEKQLFGNPDKLVELKKADLAFQQRLAELEIDLEKVHQQDRDSARQREVQVKDLTPRLLAAIVLGGYFLIQGYILSHVIDDGMRDIILRSMGTLDMALGMVLSYYFGSSSSSAQKNAIIAAQKK